MEIAQPPDLERDDATCVVRFSQDNGLAAGDIVHRLAMTETEAGPARLVRVRRPSWLNRWVWIDEAMLLPHELVPVAPRGLAVAFAAVDVAALTHGQLRWLTGVDLEKRVCLNRRRPRFWDSPGAIICFLREAGAAARAMTFVRFDKTAFAYVDTSNAE